VIVDANTVVDPRTVMVKTFDASVADCAVLASWSSKYLTIRTHLAGVNLREHIHKRVLGSYDPRISRTGNEKCSCEYDGK